MIHAKIKTLFDSIRFCDGTGILTIDDENIPVRITDLDFGSEDDLPHIEGYIYENICEPNRRPKSKVSYRNNREHSRTNTPQLPKIKDVIFNPPATIILWEDNTKTVVKCQDPDVFDPWTGLTTAIVKKVLGNKGNYCNELNKWVDKYENKDFDGDGFDLNSLIKNVLSGGYINDDL